MWWATWVRTHKYVIPLIFMFRQLFNKRFEHSSHKLTNPSRRRRHERFQKCLRRYRTKEERAHVICETCESRIPIIRFEIILVGGAIAVVPGSVWWDKRRVGGEGSRARAHGGECRLGRVAISRVVTKRTGNEDRFGLFRSGF